MREIVAFTQQQCRAEHTFFQPFLLVNKEQGGEAPFRINQHQKLLDRVHHPLGQGRPCQNKFTTTAP